MASKATVLKAIKAAVKEKRTERGETGAIASVLAEHGYYNAPKVQVGKFGRGASVRIYLYSGSPAGNLVLVTGPSVEGEVHLLEELNVTEAPDGFYVESVESSSRAVQTAKRQTQRAAERAGGRAAAPAKPKAKRKRKKRAAPAAPVPTPRPGGGEGWAPPARAYRAPPSMAPGAPPRGTFTPPSWEVEEVAVAAPEPAGDAAMMDMFLAAFQQMRAEEAA